MAYTLITANRNYSSWSLRAWLLMKALGLPFADRVQPYTLPDNWEPYRAFSPTGRVPVLLDGERKVWDSLGITLYLADRHAGVWPEDETARAFAFCAVAEMHSGFAALRTDCPMNVGVRVALNPMSDALARDVARMGELLGEGLARFGGPWLGGAQFSAVDAFFAPIAWRVRTYGLDVGPGQAWIDQVIAHPAMQQWQAEALAETWRETLHEEELRAAGTLLADHRATA